MLKMQIVQPPVQVKPTPQLRSVFSTSSKILLGNVIRHTDSHNRVLEEEEMWRTMRLGKSVEKKEDASKTNFLYDDGRQLQSGLNWAARQERQTYMDEEPIRDSSCRSTFWMRQLEKAEDKDPYRWGHGGYKEMHPHDFDSDRSAKERLIREQRKKCHGKKYGRKQAEERHGKRLSRSRYSSNSDSDQSYASHRRPEIKRSLLSRSPSMGRNTFYRSSTHKSKDRKRSKKHKSSSRVRSIASKSDRHHARKQKKKRKSRRRKSYSYSVESDGKKDSRRKWKNKELYSSDSDSDSDNKNLKARSRESLVAKHPNDSDCDRKSDKQKEKDHRSCSVETKRTKDSNKSIEMIHQSSSKEFLKLSEKQKKRTKENKQQVLDKKWKKFCDAHDSDLHGSHENEAAKIVTNKTDEQVSRSICSKNIILNNNEVCDSEVDVLKDNINVEEREEMDLRMTEDNMVNTLASEKIVDMFMDTDLNELDSEKKKPVSTVVRKQFVVNRENTLKHKGKPGDKITDLFQELTEDDFINKEENMVAVSQCKRLIERERESSSSCHKKDLMGSASEQENVNIGVSTDETLQTPSVSGKNGNCSTKSGEKLQVSLITPNFPVTGSENSQNIVEITTEKRNFVDAETKKKCNTKGSEQECTTESSAVLKSNDKYEKEKVKKTDMSFTSEDDSRKQNLSLSLVVYNSKKDSQKNQLTTKNKELQDQKEDRVLGSGLVEPKNGKSNSDLVPHTKKDMKKGSKHSSDSHSDSDNNKKRKPTSNENVKIDSQSDLRKLKSRSGDNVKDETAQREKTTKVISEKKNCVSNSQSDSGEEKSQHSWKKKKEIGKRVKYSTSSDIGVRTQYSGEKDAQTSQKESRSAGSGNSESETSNKGYKSSEKNKQILVQASRKKHRRKKNIAGHSELEEVEYGKSKTDESVGESRRKMDINISGTKSDNKRRMREKDNRVNKISSLREKVRNNSESDNDHACVESTVTDSNVAKYPINKKGEIFSDTENRNSNTKRDDKIPKSPKNKRDTSSDSENKNRNRHVKRNKKEMPNTESSNSDTEHRNSHKKRKNETTKQQRNEKETGLSDSDNNTDHRSSRTKRGSKTREHHRNKRDTSSSDSDTDHRCSRTKRVSKTREHHRNKRDTSSSDSDTDHRCSRTKRVSKTREHHRNKRDTSSSDSDNDHGSSHAKRGSKMIKHHRNKMDTSSSDSDTVHRKSRRRHSVRSHHEERRRASRKKRHKSSSSDSETSSDHKIGRYRKKYDRNHKKKRAESQSSSNSDNRHRRRTHRFSSSDSHDGLKNGKTRDKCNKRKRRISSTSSSGSEAAYKRSRDSDGEKRRRQKGCTHSTDSEKRSPKRHRKKQHGGKRESAENVHRKSRDKQNGKSKSHKDCQNITEQVVVKSELLDNDKYAEQTLHSSDTQKSRENPKEKYDKFDAQNVSVKTEPLDDYQYSSKSLSLKNVPTLQKSHKTRDKHKLKKKCRDERTGSE